MGISELRPTHLDVLVQNILSEYTIDCVSIKNI